MFKIYHYLKLISYFMILTLLFNATINGVFGKLIELNDRNLDKIVGLLIYFYYSFNILD